MIKRHDVKKGFTLTEVVVALVIISIAAIGIFATLSHTKRATVAGQQKAICVLLLESQMNELKRIGAVGLTHDDSMADVALTDDDIKNGVCPAGKPEHYCRAINESHGQMRGLLVAEIHQPNPADENFKEALVTAVWFDAIGIKHSESVLGTVMKE